VYPREGTVAAAVIDTGHPVVAAAIPRRSYGEVTLLGGPAMMLPLAGGGGRPHGALAVIRSTGAPRFLDSDVDMATDFASHASVALELRDARRARERVALLEDRSRIARDLHDNVIQRLFGAGLALHSVDMAAMQAPVATKVAMVGEMIDQAISEIRKSVFALRSTQPGITPRHRLLDVLGESVSIFPAPPKITFEGHVDRWVPDTLVDDLAAVVREGLSNAARHAHAQFVDVTVGADERQISVLISDDGPGPNGSKRRSGIANLEDRARAWGGSSVLRPGLQKGAVLEWRVPTPNGKGPG
jgi:signal transduction histidine kinase